jgi:hypothetical protein
MAVKPRRVDSTARDAASLLNQLDQLRLDNDWSYRELSEDMARAGCPMTAQGLQTVLRRTQEPWDRTLHKIQRYLASRLVAAAPKRASAAR